MRHRDYIIGGISLTLWTALEIDPLLDRLIQKKQSDPDVLDERMPYWAELWPSSFLLAEVMANHAPKLPKGEFLELGCGPALAGVYAARLGKSGTVTDYLQEARWLAKANAMENHVEDKIKVEHLDWREPPDKTFSWILAGDVAYEPRNFRPLMECWTKMLSPGGEVWLAEPGRSIAKKFFTTLDENGWSSEVIGQKERVKVYRITQLHLEPYPDSHSYSYA